MSAGPLLAVLEPAARADAVRLAAELERTGGSACLLGPHGEILYVNEDWDRLATGRGGARGAQLLGKRYASFVSGPEARSFFDGIWLRVVAGHPVACRADSSPAARGELSTSFTPVRLGSGFGAVVVHSAADAGGPARSSAPVASP